MPFEMQPIMDLITHETVGYELLYRGIRPGKWKEVDLALLNHLKETTYKYRIYVNLSNDSLIEFPAAHFVDAAKDNDIIFELSESYTDNSTFHMIAKTVNVLVERGLKFAIDDFGSGRDGLSRLYALNRVNIIKLDGSLLHSAMSRADAMRAIKLLVHEWIENKVTTVVECVETQQQYEVAADLGVDCVQGWYVDELVSNLKSHTSQTDMPSTSKETVGCDLIKATISEVQYG